jgi:hypothetical protein
MREAGMSLRQIAQRVGHHHSFTVSRGNQCHFKTILLANGFRRTSRPMALSSRQDVIRDLPGLPPLAPCELSGIVINEQEVYDQFKILNIENFPSHLLDFEILPFYAPGSFF